MIDVNEVQEIVIDDSCGVYEIDEVNKLLNEGWILINVTQRGHVSDDESFYSTVYTLGKKG